MPNRCQAIAFDQARQDRFEEASQAVQHLNNASQIQTHLIADASQRNAMHVMHERNAGDESIAKESFQLAVFVQELVDSTLLFQTVLANGVRLHPCWRSEAEKAGATASHRYCRASRRRG